MAKSVLKIEQRTELRADWISGMSQKDLSDKYKVSPTRVTQILNDDDVTAHRLLQQKIELDMSKETAAVVEIKNTLLSVYNKAAKQADDSDNPILYLKDLTPAFALLDKTQRLNQSKPTDITQNQNINLNINVNKEIEHLDTPEKQQEYLRNQFKKQEDDRHSKDKHSTADVIDA